MRRLALALLLALLPGLASAAPSRAEAKEKALRDRAAAELVSLARWCAENGAKAAGETALAAAREADASAKGLDEAAAALAAAKDGESPERDLARKRKAAADALLRVADLPCGDKEAAASARLFLRALEVDPDPARRKLLPRRIADAAREKRYDAMGMLLVGARTYDPEGVAAGRYRAVEEELAREDALLLGSPDQALVGYVSLPRDWTPKRRWPVLVVVEGAGCSFRGNLDGFRKQRGSRPEIVVAPFALSCTNALEPANYPAYPASLLEEWSGKRLDFDLPGLRALLAVVRERFSGEEKAFVTGFSGGGLLAYAYLFQHPEEIAGAAPACANFGGGGLPGAPGAKDGGPPVLLLTGEKDPHRDAIHGREKPGIEGQTDLAQENLARLGYTNVRRVMVPGAGHSSLPREVLEFVDGVLEAAGRGR